MQLPKFFVCPLLLLIVAGCRSGEFTHYVAPEITGRVLAADTHQPLANATVRRVGASNTSSSQQVKGGQLMMQSDGAQTDADGKFVLGGKSVFALFRKPGWWSVEVAYSRSGYETLQTNYTGSSVTSHTADGAPVINTGDILLNPLAK